MRIEAAGYYHGQAVRSVLALCSPVVSVTASTEDTFRARGYVHSGSETGSPDEINFKVRINRL